MKEARQQAKKELNMAVIDLTIKLKLQRYLQAADKRRDECEHLGIPSDAYTHGQLKRAARSWKKAAIHKVKLMKSEAIRRKEAGNVHMERPIVKNRKHQRIKSMWKEFRDNLAADEKETTYRPKYKPTIKSKDSRLRQRQKRIRLRKACAAVGLLNGAKSFEGVELNDDLQGLTAEALDRLKGAARKAKARRKIIRKQHKADAASRAPGGAKAEKTRQPPWRIAEQPDDEIKRIIRTAPWHQSSSASSGQIPGTGSAADLPPLKRSTSRRTTTPQETEGWEVYVAAKGSVDDDDAKDDKDEGKPEEVIENSRPMYSDSESSFPEEYKQNPAAFAEKVKIEMKRQGVDCKGAEATALALIQNPAKEDEFHSWVIDEGLLGGSSDEDEEGDNADDDKVGPTTCEDCGKTMDAGQIRTCVICQQTKCSSCMAKHWLDKSADCNGYVEWKMIHWSRAQLDIRRSTYNYVLAEEEIAASAINSAEVLRQAADETATQHKILQRQGLPEVLGPQSIGKDPTPKWSARVAPWRRSKGTATMRGPSGSDRWDQV